VLKSYITDFYKELFGPSHDENLSLDESRNEDIPQISAEDNKKLTAVFTENEVKDAVFQMKHNKAPALMVFPQNFINFFGRSLKGI
jgi:hypothetical protein